MEKFKAMLPYLGIDMLAFYLLPLLINNTTMAMLVLLVAMPLVCFNSAVYYTSKNGFNAWFSLMVGIGFIPSIYLYFNDTAFVYVAGFASMSLFGSFVGKHVKSK